MKKVKATGRCTKCNRKTEAIGCDEEGARFLFIHFHGSDFGHGFEGDDIRFFTIDTEATPKRRKR